MSNNFESGQYQYHQKTKKKQNKTKKRESAHKFRNRKKLFKKEILI